MTQKETASINGSGTSTDAAESYLTVFIDGQAFGIPVLQTRDVLLNQTIYPLPLVAPAIAGNINLRGHIVTAIDIRTHLGLSANDNSGKTACIVVQHETELCCLLFDHVGDVIPLYETQFEDTPVTLDPKWRKVARGIYKHDDTLVIALDIEKLLDLSCL